MNRVCRIWSAVLGVLFLLLCIRYVCGVMREETLSAWPALIIASSGLVLGCWRPQAALFAFTAALLFFTASAIFVGVISPLSLLFSTISLGRAVSLLATHNGSRAGRHAGRMPELPESVDSGVVEMISNALATIIFLSLLLQLWEHRTAPGFGHEILSRSTLGFGDKNYFLESAFLWLQGLFYFRNLCAEGPQILKWIRPVFAMYSVALVAFISYQYAFNIPEPYQGFAYFFPCEDISSFGSVAVAILTFVAASRRRCSPWKSAFDTLWILCLLVAVAASWSRAAWLACILSTLVIAWIRLPRKWIALPAGLVVAAGIVVNLNANRDSWLRNPYFLRAVGLMRVDTPFNKSPERFFLYHKALGMIRERPITGHGIGSFYETSRGYAAPGDIRAGIPDFAHNVFLQIASETGVLTALLFATLIGMAIWKGCRAWNAQAAAPPIGTNIAQTGGVQPGSAANAAFGFRTYLPYPLRDPDTTDNHALLGVMLALGSYMLTQMTANSLNVYLSNQFFFWFLMAAVFAASTSIIDPGDSKRA